jgi:putative ABC transport system permease protein
MQDLRYGVRMLAKNPGFTAVALITLALGVGVNTAVYSVINAMQMKPLQLAAPEKLAFIWSGAERKARSYSAIGALDFLDWREQSESFDDMALFQQSGRILTGGGEPERVRVVHATGNLLAMLGLDAHIGRVHRVEEDSVTAERVVVLTDRLWQRRFGKKPDVLGQTIELNDTPHTIIGVLPPEIDDLMLWYDVDLFTPLSIDPAKLKRSNRSYQSIGRLKPDVTIEQAQTEMSGIAARLAKAYPNSNADSDVWVQPMMEYFNPPQDRLATIALLAAVGSVLLIACVNLANLLLAKATSRGKEFAVRVALGAGRARLIRQLLTESLLLALIGGALGVLAGTWGVDVFVASMDESPLRRDEVGLNTSVLAYALFMSIAAALAFGLAPALSASKLSLTEALKEGAAAASAGVSRNRLRNALVIGQLAIALPLLICSGLVIKSLVALKSVDLGFNPERLLTAQIDLPTYRYGEAAQRATFFHDAIEAIEARPGIQVAGAASSIPLGVFADTRVISVEGRTVHEGAGPDVAGYQSVTPDYFRLMETPLISGRFFTEHDHADGRQVTIINDRMAKRYWPDRDAIGERFKLDKDRSEEPWMLRGLLVTRRTRFRFCAARSAAWTRLYQFMVFAPWPTLSTGESPTSGCSRDCLVDWQRSP